MLKSVLLCAQPGVLRLGLVSTILLASGCSTTPVSQSSSIASLSATSTVKPSTTTVAKTPTTNVAKTTKASPSVAVKPPKPVEDSGSLLDSLRSSLNSFGGQKLADGSEYSGESLNGKKSGQGVYTWPDGSRYDGSWVNDKRTGQGIWISGTGDRYEGTWLDDKRMGQGVYTYLDGRRYEGEFVNDKPTGYGLFKDTKGITYRNFRAGEFKEKDPPLVSIPFGPEIIKSALACTNLPEGWWLLEGSCAKNGPEGEVRLVQNDGMSDFKGHFIEGKPSGEMRQYSITKDSIGGVSAVRLTGRATGPNAFSSAEASRMELLNNKPVWVGFFKGPMQGPNPDGKGKCLHAKNWETCEIKDGQRIDQIHTARLEAEHKKKLHEEKARQLKAEKEARLRMAEAEKKEKARLAQLAREEHLRRIEAAKQEKIRWAQMAKENRLRQAEAARAPQPVAPPPAARPSMGEQLVNQAAKSVTKEYASKIIQKAAGSSPIGGLLAKGFNSWMDDSDQAPQQQPQTPQPQEQQPSSSNLSQKKGSGSGNCSALAGKWTHPVGGTWTFAGKNATMVLNSTNYGPRAQQITVLNLSSCSKGTMTYKITRAALINTVEPQYAYDKTPANAPQQADKWNKVHNQAYALNGSSLQFGNYTYTKQ